MSDKRWRISRSKTGGGDDTREALVVDEVVTPTESPGENMGLRAVMRVPCNAHHGVAAGYAPNARARN